MHYNRDCGERIDCEKPTILSVTETLYTIQSEIATIGRQVYENLLYGHKLAEDHISKVRKLRIIHGVLNKVRGALRNQGSLCLSCTQIQTLCEAARRVVGISSCAGNHLRGMDIDQSRLAEWTAKNPFCVSPDNWNKAMYEICELIDLKIVKIDKEKACQLAFDVVRKAVDCEVFIEIAQNHKDCKIKYNIFTSEKACEQNYAGTLTKQECKGDLKILKKHYPKCEIGLHDYVNIINCGVGARLITKIYSCGMSLKFSSSKGCPMIVTADGKEYYFTDFDVHNEADIWSRLKNLSIV